MFVPLCYKPVYVFMLAVMCEHCAFTFWLGFPCCWPVRASVACFSRVCPIVSCLRLRCFDLDMRFVGVEAFLRTRRRRCATFAKLQRLLKLQVLSGAAPAGCAVFWLVLAREYIPASRAKVTLRRGCAPHGVDGKFSDARPPRRRIDGRTCLSKWGRSRAWRWPRSALPEPRASMFKLFGL